MKNYEFWFIVGSQTLYGPEVLETVDARAREMAAYLTERLPYPLVYKGTAKSAEEISAVVREANYQEKCCGLVTWCHTFSPSKMWINGLEVLRKPYCHFVTQYNRDIPNDEIDMDFMNLNQAAHGDREHGFAGARLRLPRKIIAGYWQNPTAAERLGRWMRTAIGVAVSRNMKVMRFGDNMRDVAVTEGDKIEAQLKFGWQVNTWAVGDLVAEMATVTEEEVKAQMAAYLEKYDLATENREAVAYQAREEIAIKRMLDREGCRAFADTFQDLYGLEQLPGLAAQDLMGPGYGFGGLSPFRRRGRLESVGAAGGHESHGQRRKRRFRFYGGLHLSSGAGQRVFAGCTYAGGLPQRGPGKAPDRNTSSGHWHEPKGSCPAGIQRQGGERHCGESDRYGWPVPADRSGYRGGGSDYGHAKSACGPGHVAGHAGSAYGCGMLDHRRRCPPYGSEL